MTYPILGRRPRFWTPTNVATLACELAVYATAAVLTVLWLA